MHEVGGALLLLRRELVEVLLDALLDGWFCHGNLLGEFLELLARRTRSSCVPILPDMASSSVQLPPPGLGPAGAGWDRLRPVVVIGGVVRRRGGGGRGLPLSRGRGRGTRG